MDACHMNADHIVSQLFSTFDEQPLRHQIELIDALLDFIYNWLRKNGVDSTVAADKSWKVAMSTLVINDHECDVMSLFTNSKLLQKLIGTALTRNTEHSFCNSDRCNDLHDDNFDDDEEYNAESIDSSGTDAMEYEDIDRLLLSIDATSLGNRVIDACKDSGGQGTETLSYSEAGDPASEYRAIRACSPMHQTFSSPALENSIDGSSTSAPRTKRKYRKRKSNNAETVSGAISEMPPGKAKKRTIQVVDKDSSDAGKASPPELITDSDGVVRFKCTVCNALFTRIQHHRRHVILHYGLRPHVCHLCDKSFARAEHLRKHMVKHADGRVHRKHPCLECEQEFGTSREVKEHKRLEHAKPVSICRTNTSPIKPAQRLNNQCHICEQICANAGQLRSHVRAHRAANKPFMCDECGQRFTRHGHLQRHMRLHTGDKPFMCNRCACQFARNDHLRRHLQAHLLEDSQPKPTNGTLVGLTADFDSARDIYVDESSGTAARCPLGDLDIERSNVKVKGEVSASLCSGLSSRPSSASELSSVNCSRSCHELIVSTSRPSLLVNCDETTHSLRANYEDVSPNLNLDSIGQS